MAASISMKGAKLAGEVVKKTAGYMAGAVTDYFSEAMPSTSNVAKEAKSEIATISNQMKTTSTQLMQKTRNIRNTVNMRRIMNWYLGESGEGDFDDNLNFDIDVDSSSAEIAEAQIGEAERSANKISSAVIESNQHLLEGQINLTATLESALDKQTAVISAGFDRTNATLDKILEVVTKNTAALITTTSAMADTEKSNSAKDNLLTNAKFSLTDYKKMVMENMKKDPALGTAMSFLPMLAGGGWKQMADPQFIASMLFSGAMNKFSPKAKSTLQGLDAAINETIMNSLIRIADNKNNPLGRIFGIDGSRKNAEGSRSSLEVKAVPFDSIAHEAITNAIPGYLQKIYAHLSGENVVYDYRSRQFKSKGKIKSEFIETSMANGAIRRSNSRVKELIGTDDFGSMMYDILLTEMGAMEKNGRGSAMFSNSKAFADSMSTLLRNSGAELQNKDINRLRVMGKNIIEGGLVDYMALQSARENAERNKRMQQYISEADKYNVDLSYIKSTKESEISKILELNGMKSGDNTSYLTGTDYTNRALYEINRILNRGLNVFQMGSSQEMTSPFENEAKLLPAPAQFKPKELNRPQRVNANAIYSMNADYANPLMEGEDAGDYGKWAKGKFKELSAAITSGNPEAVRDVMLSSFANIGQISAKKVNDMFGNISGSIKYKLFGKGYSYTNENGEEVRVSDNNLGGVFGVFKNKLFDTFGNAKRSAANWLKEVGSYFDFGEAKEDDKTVVSRRKKILATSVGAMAGAGLLGGPFGLIMGGLAGSALSTMDIGGKIKEFMFGAKDGAKGAVEKLFSKVVDPIQYQFEKTAHKLGQDLKKNIIGPLSDLGFAIKERIKAAADSKFGQVFATIGKWILAPFKNLAKGALDLFHLPTSLAGAGVRGASGIVTGTIGSSIDSMAKSIAGRTTYTNEEGQDVRVKKAIKERIKKREEEINYDFDDRDTWQQKKDASRRAFISDLKDAWHGDEVASDVHTLTELGSQEGSIYTHDQGMHDILNNIYEFITGKKVKASGSGIKPVGEDDGFANTALIAGAQIASEADYDSTDQKNTNALIAENEKEKPNRGVIRNLLNKMMIHNNKDSQEKKKEEKTLWDYIKDTLGNVGGFLGGILDNFGAILPIVGAIAGIATLLGSINDWNLADTVQSLKDSVNKVGTNVVDGIRKLIFGDDDKKTDVTDEGINAALAVANQHVTNKWSWVNPFGRLFWNDTDAAGNAIVNQAGSRSKTNYQFWNPMIQAFMKDIPGASKNAALNWEMANNPQYQLLGDEYVNENTVKTTGGSTFINGLLRNVASVGIMSAFGSLTSMAGTGVAKMFGLDDETAKKVGDISGRATTAGLALDKAVGVASKGKHTAAVDIVLDLLGKAFKILAEKTKSFKVLSKFGNTIDDFFNKLFGKVEKKITEKIAIMILERLGIDITAEATAAVTYGISIAALGVIGLVSGYCGTEYLFRVGPNQATAGMKATSAIVRAAFFALEGVPDVGIIVAAMDLIDDLLIRAILHDKNGNGISLKGALAELVYKLIAGKEAADALEQQQAAFSEEREYYNETYGTNLDAAEFSDLVNNDGIISALWRGKAQYGEDGHIKFNEDGSRASGGIKGWIENKFGTSVADLVEKTPSNIGKFLLSGAKILGYGISGQIGEMWKYSAELNEDDPFASIAKVLLIGEKLSLSPVSAVISLNRFAVESIGKGFKKAMNVGTTFIKESQYANELVTDRRSDVRDLFRIEEDPDNPLDGFQKALIMGSRLSIIPFAISMKLYKALGKEIVPYVGKMASNAGSIISAEGEVLSKTIEGHPLEMLDVYPDLQDEQFTFWIGHIAIASSKMMMFVPSLLSFLGHKAYNAIAPLFGGAGEEINNLIDAHSKISNAAWDGDLDSWAYSDYDSDNAIMGGLAKTMFFLDKGLHFVPLVLVSLGKAVGNTIAKVIDPNDMEELGKSLKKNEEAADLGDPEKVWDNVPSFNTNTFSGNISYGIDVISKIFSTIFATFNKFGNWLKKVADKIKNDADLWKIANWLWDMLDYDDVDETLSSPTGGASIGGPRKRIGGSLMINGEELTGDTSTPSDNSKANSTADTMARLRQRNGDSKKSSSSSSGAKLSETEGGNPLNTDYTITSGFGWRSDPYPGMHEGVDLATADGSNSWVNSRYSGEVIGVKKNVKDSDTAHEDSSGNYIYSGSNEAGNYVNIRTDNGMIIRNYHLAEMSIPAAIKVGARVNVGDKLGMVGSTGWSTGPHLHYQIENARGIAVDPTPYLNGTSTISDDTSTSTTDSSYSTPLYDTSTYISSNNASQIDNNNKGILAQLIEHLTTIGSGLLSYVTGGLYKSSSSSSSSNSSSLSMSNTSNVDGAEAFVKMVAKEIGTTEYPPGSNKVKYNTWYYGKEVSGDAYPWCMTFVQWCFNEAGLTLPYKTAACRYLWEWYMTHEPERCHTTDPKPGDIIFYKGSNVSGHTGIVETVNGDTFTTIEGNTSTREFDANGGCVARHTRNKSYNRILGFVTAVDFAALAAVNNANNVKVYGDGPEELWKYFKSLGYSDKATAAILGCWMAESGNNARRIEWDYGSVFKNYGYDKLINDRDAMDEYTQKLFAQYDSQGLKYKRDGYRGPDGHWYAGLGYAGWTGPRAKALIDFAKNNGLDWGAPSTQLAYLDTELNGAYAGLKNSLENAADVNEATRIFQRKFEGISVGYEKRRDYANSLYSQYANKYNTGGPRRKHAEYIRDNNGKIIEQQDSKNMGGPRKSSLSGVNLRTSTPQRMRPRIGGVATDPTLKSNTPVLGEIIRTAPAALETPVVAPTTTDISGVVSLLSRVVEELIKINNNTADSSNLLVELNNKDFVDQGLRDSLNALSDRRSTQNSRLPSSSANAATRLAMP